jgi:hypothetical protein
MLRCVVLSGAHLHLMEQAVLLLLERHAGRAEHEPPAGDNQAVQNHVTSRQCNSCWRTCTEHMPAGRWQEAIFGILLAHSGPAWGAEKCMPAATAGAGGSCSRCTAAGCRLA